MNVRLASIETYKSGFLSVIQGTAHSYKTTYLYDRILKLNLKPTEVAVFDSDTRPCEIPLKYGTYFNSVQLIKETVKTCQDAMNLFEQLNLSGIKAIAIDNIGSFIKEWRSLSRHHKLKFNNDLHELCKDRFVLIFSDSKVINHA